MLAYVGVLLSIPWREVTLGRRWDRWPILVAVATGCSLWTLTVVAYGFDIAAKIFDIFHIFLKRSPIIRPYKSLRCLFVPCWIPRNSRRDSGWTKKHTAPNNNFLDKMTVENVAVFLSVVVGSAAGSCWRFHRRSIFGPPQRRKHKCGDLLLQRVWRGFFFKKPPSKFCVSS